MVKEAVSGEITPLFIISLQRKGFSSDISTEKPVLFLFLPRSPNLFPREKILNCRKRLQIYVLTSASA